MSTLETIGLLAIAVAVVLAIAIAVIRCRLQRAADEARRMRVPIVEHYGP